jgi:hypothetical protein
MAAATHLGLPPLQGANVPVNTRKKQIADYLGIVLD